MDESQRFTQLRLRMHRGRVREGRRGVLPESPVECPRDASLHKMADLAGQDRRWAALKTEPQTLAYIRNRGAHESGPPVRRREVPTARRIVLSALEAGTQPIGR